MLSDVFRNSVAGEFRRAPEIRSRRHDRGRRAGRARRMFRCRAASPIRVSSASIPAGIGRSRRSDRRDPPRGCADLALAVRPARSSRRLQQQSGNLTTGHGEGPDGQHLRFVSQRVEFPDFGDARAQRRTHASYFLVAGNVTEVENEIARFNGTLIWSFALLGLGLIVGDLPAGAHRPCCRCKRVQRGAGPHSRRQGAPPRRTISRRDRAARRRTEQPDRAQRRSGGPRAHPCVEPRAFPEDAVDGAGERSRGRSRGRSPTPCSARW